MPSAAQPTLAPAQLPEMNSAERNEAHEAACTPCRGLYQAQINAWRHSPGAPVLPGPIPGLLGVGNERGEGGSH